MNSLLILFGESFRLGGQGNRNRGSEESYKEQINASLSHIKFIERLKKNNINMTVSINSYTTKFLYCLNDIYKHVLLDSIHYVKLIGQSKLIHNCIDRITNINNYDFILCMRIDLFLKDNFFEIFNPYSDKILFPSVCFKPYHKCGVHPRVNDTMMFVPKKYFNFIKKVQLDHNTWYDLIEYHKLSYEDLDVMLNTYHDSDSAKDFNPIYYIVNRYVSNTHTTKEIFDKYNAQAPAATAGPTPLPTYSASSAHRYTWFCPLFLLLLLLLVLLPLLLPLSTPSRIQASLKSSKYNF